MIHIRKTKTWYGLRYAVVEPFTYQVLDDNDKLVTKTEYYPVEYIARGDKRDVRVALFPVTKEGLNKAKEIQRAFKRAK